MFKRVFTPATSRTLVLALFGGACFGAIACGEDDPTDSSLEVELSCADYCRKAVECDDDIDQEECEVNCEDAAKDCMADEQDEALNQLDECSEETCDDFGGCTVGAGLQCTFGI